MGRYELHEWVYQLHNSLDEFKKREHGIYAIVANAPGSAPLDNLGDETQQESQHQEQQPQGIYAVVRKSNVKPTRQAPPVPPRSDEMNILTDDTPPDSAFESTGDKGRELLVSFGSGSDNDYLAQFRKHKRSLSDSLVTTRVIDVGLAAGPSEQNKGTSTLKKTTSATNLTEEAVVKDKGFELPANVVKRKRMNKRRKTIAHGGRRLSRSHSPPSEPPPPPPSGEKPPEVNQAIIDALYALDEELGQNIAVSPNTSNEAPIHIDHTTVFATFQSPPDSAHGLTSPTTGHVISPDHPQSEVVHHEVPNGDVVHQNGHATNDVDFHPNDVDESHCIKPSKAAGKAKIDDVKVDVPSNAKKVPPPVKPKPSKPSPPLRSTSYNKTAELKTNKSLPSPVTVNPPSLKPPISTADVKQNKEGTEQQKVRSPPRVTFPEELEKVVKRKSLTTFNLDDLNKEAIERKGNPLPSSPTRANPLSPSKPKNYSLVGAFSKHNDVVATSTSIPQSGTEESMTKIFQNWPNHGLSNGSVGSPMSPVHSEPSQWRDSMADQHIYDDPWDRKMRAINMAKSQGIFKPGDRNSLERRRTFSNGNQMNGYIGGNRGPVDRSFSLDQHNSVIKPAPRRGASIEDLYNRAASTAFTNNFKKGASTENLSSLDPSSPLYVYKKALKNHQQLQQEEEEKERSYTLPLKGSARRRSQQGFPPQQSTQTSLRPRINNPPGNPPSARIFPTAQNDSRKFGPYPVQQQQQPPMQQYQQMTESRSLQSQPPRRTNGPNNYMKTNINPNYRPYVLNTGGRPISSVEQNGMHMNRRPMNNYFHAPIEEDLQYYQSTRMSYDKSTDSTILRSLV